MKNNGDTADVKKGIALASAQMKQLSNIWKASNISRNIKISLLKTLVLFVLLYGCKILKLTKEKRDTFQNKCLRRMFKIQGQRHISNKTVLKTTTAEKISQEVRRRIWKWIGHVLRKNKKSDYALTLGRRREGCPKITWR